MDKATLQGVSSGSPVHVDGVAYIINGETVMILTIGPEEHLYVASSSRPGRWYEIIDGICCCEAAQHGNPNCHHLTNIQRAIAQTNP